MQIAPRTFNQVLNDGMLMLARVWKSLLVPAVGAAIPLGALTLAGFRLTDADELMNLLFTDPQAVEVLTEQQFADLTIQFLRGAFLAVIFGAVAAGFIALATNRVVAAQIAGSPLSGGEASRFALTRLVPLILAGALAAAAVMVGLFAFVIPGVWLAIMLILTPQVMALEDRGVLGSLQRSFELVRGHWWPTLGFMTLVGLLGTAAGWMIQLVAAPLTVVGSAAASAGLAFVVGTLVQGMLTAAIAVMASLWYLNLRARRESLFSENLL